MFNVHLKLNIRMNFTVAVTLIPMDRLSPSLNSVQQKGGSIFTFPLKNGGWNSCKMATSLCNIPGGLHRQRDPMEPLFLWQTTSSSIAVQPNPEYITHVGIFTNVYHHFIYLTLPLPLIRPSKTVPYRVQWWIQSSEDSRQWAQGNAPWRIHAVGIDVISCT